MNCQECQAALVNGVCPNAEAHAAVRFAGEIATAMSRALEPVLEGVTTSQAELVEAVRAIRPVAGEPGTPGEEDEQTHQERLQARGIDPTDRMRDPYTREGWTRGDFEIALLLQGGARALRAPVELNYSDQLRNAIRYHLFEDPRSPRIQVRDTAGNLRAMDSAESGYGADLVGAQYVADMWDAARNLDSLVSDIRSVPMAAPTSYVPISGEIPEMLFVGESTTNGASAYASSKTPSSKVTLTAKKFTIQQIWSAELEEDSIVPFIPFLRQMLAVSAAQHLGSAYYNGDTTNAGTGNINSDDADPGDTKHYLAWDGIRHDWLVTTTGQGINQAAALDIANINVARGRLSGIDDDVDNAVKTINWGRNARELRIVCDWDTYMNLLGSDKVVTVDKYGANAPIVNGELGSIWGIPIISPSYASKTEADGKASGTEASNTKGQITVFAPMAYLAGVRREVQFFMDRIQGTDQFLLELYTRRAFTRFGTTGAAGIYNITV